MHRSVLAFDFGASSGRAMMGCLDGGRLTIEEIHRFSNDPVTLGDTFYWDVLRLTHEIREALVKARQTEEYESIGIDTWGVDFGLLDRQGRLLGNVRHYRDARNLSAARQVLEKLPMEQLYARTGIQYAPFNTVFQLHAVKEDTPYLLENAQRLLMLPDLLGFFLSGAAHTDYSEASTSGLLDVKTGGWAWDIIDRLGYPRHIFGEISPSGQVIGELRPQLCEELLLKSTKVISVASHDTASAVAAVPSLEKDFAYISCGTWSLFGTELDAPIASEAALRYNFTNEGGYGGKIRFLKNIMGMWLIQESRRHWKRAGMDMSFAELEQRARECAPFQSLIDVDDESFLAPGDIPSRVREYCKKTHQPAPESVGEVMQCIYSSIALKYRHTLEGLTEVTKKKYAALHMVGGGIKDKLLCQLAADACGIPVIAGPVEATVIGNVAVQLIALGALADIGQARQVIASSFDVARYEPSAEPERMKIAYLQYKKLLGL
ncbi:MAG: rhamnulokinase [Provencibacterium sp.]|jgi:rhamnulokinase|nr:rhamnulokinase [Provencibacterium sp.]